MLRVTGRERRVEAEQREPATRVRHRAFGKIDAAESRPRFRIALVISAETDTDLQHPLASGRVELGELRDYRLQLVAPACLLAVTLALLVREVQLLATGSPVPELEHCPFAGIHCAFHRRSAL
jgi:hypothetical protein